jgi:PAS domain S-box-containing protein
MLMDREARFLAPVPGREDAATPGRPGRRPVYQELQLLRALARALAEAESLEAALEVVLEGVCQTTRWALGQVGLKAGVAIPVFSGQEVVCVLEFFVREERAHDQRLVSLVAELGGLLGGAIRRVQAEQALRASEARHRAVVDTAADAIVTMGADGLIRSFNHAAEQIFGYSADEIVGQPLVRLIPERFRRRHLAGLLRFLATGESRLLGRPTEVVGRRRDGSEVALELTLSAIPEAAGTLFAGILRDVTERKRAEAQRAALLAAEQEHARRLRELATLKADFTAMVAHELGSPLAAIGGLAEMLSTGELDPTDQAHVIGAILAETHLLTTLVSDVQAAAGVERDDFALRPRAVPASALLADAAAFARTLSGQHPLTVASSPPDLVWADPERIGQVLRNLLANAARHTPPGTPIELQARRTGHRVRIEVTDWGPGISPEDLVRIFEKFGRASDARNRHVPGVGLGLYISRRLCRAHGTELEVASSPESGTVFSFDLEVHDDAGAVG